MNITERVRLWRLRVQANLVMAHYSQGSPIRRWLFRLGPSDEVHLEKYAALFDHYS